MAFRVHSSRAVFRHFSLFFLLLLFTIRLSAQGYCLGDTVVFTEPAHPVEYDDVAYKTAPQIDEWDFEVPENIRLRVYSPTDLPPGEKRLLVVLIHGGYFIWGSYLDFDALARYFAEKGFVAATVGYRLCHRGDCEVARLFDNPCNVSWNNSFLASAYVAAVDVKDGIRWLQERAADYHIDADKVVVAGHSAGAFTALNVVFTDQDEIQQLVSSAGVSGKYLGEPLGEVDGIRACIAMAGASLQTDWIDPEEIQDEKIAVGIVHGTSDGVVHYGESKAIPCCQTYGAMVYGGCEVAQRVKELNGNYYLLTGEGYGHDIGEAPWFDTLLVQLPAFIVKTVICGDDVQKHGLVKRPAALPLCPNNTPALPASLTCDVAPVTPGILTPVYEAPGEPADNGLALEVYPNPVQSPLTLRSTAPAGDGTWLVTLFGPDGRQLERREVALRGTATLALPDLPSGIYLLRLQNPQNGRSGTVRLTSLR